MPSVSVSICEKCGNSFTIDLDECRILPNMRVKPSKQNDETRIIKTWADWVEHISNNCPKCRILHPPIQAIDDWDKHQQKLK